MADAWDSVVDFGTGASSDDWSSVVSFDIAPPVATQPPAIDNGAQVVPADDPMARMVARNEQLRSDLRKSLGREPTNEDIYQANIQEWAEAEDKANPRGFITGSLPYRTVETAVESLGGKGVSMITGAESAMLDAVGAKGLAGELDLARDVAQGTMKQDQVEQAINDKKGWLGETLTSWTRQGGAAVLETAPIAAAGGLPAVAATFAASTFDEQLANGRSVPEAASHGLIEGAFTILGGKVLGAGVGKLASKLGGGAVAEGVSGKAARYLAQKLPINETLAKISTAAGAEATEEFATEVAHYIVDAANDREEWSAKRLWERSKGAIGPSLLAGGFGEFGIKLFNTFQERQRDLPTVAKAIEDAQEYKGEIPTESRRGFARATGNAETSKVYREAYVDELRRINEEAAWAADSDSESGPVPELSGERYARKPLTPDELKAHNKELAHMRRVGVPESTLAELEQLDPRIASDLLSQASERAQGENEQIAELWSQYAEVYGDGKRADFRSARAAKAAARGGGYGAIKSGILYTLSSGAKQFKYVSAGDFLPDVLEEYRRGGEPKAEPVVAAEPLLVQPTITASEVFLDAKKSTGGFGPLALGMNPKVQEMGRKLANIAETPRERDYLADLDRVATEAGEPGIKHDRDVQTAAMYRLETDPAKERANIIQRAAKGEQLGDEDTLIAKQLFQDEAFEALRTGDEQKLAEASAFRDAYRTTGTEQARAFRQRHDPLGGKTILEATPKQRLGAMMDELFDRTPKERKAREKALKNGDTAELEKLDRAHRARLKRIEKQLNELGLSLEQLPQLAKDPISTAKVRAQIGAANKSFWDKLFEYRSSMGLFSGPQTQVANLGGNLVHGVYDYAIQAPTEAVINEMMRSMGAGDPAGRRLGEFPHLWKGIEAGISQGMKNALITWKTEVPVTSVGDKYDKPNVAIGGTLGRVVRAPGYRLLSAADEFFNTLFANIEVGGAAFRLGLLKGLEGQELQAHIHAETTTPDSLSWRLALAHAAKLTFHQELSGAPKKALDAAMAIRRVPSMRWFIPVVSFPVKATATAVRKAPLTGDVAMLQAAYENYRAGRPPAFGMSRRFAERALAWGVVAAIASTLDDEEPWITGASSNPEGTPPSSIKIGDQWLSYARVEPFATILGGTVDGIMVAKSGSTDKIASAVFDIPAKQIASKTFLSGLSDVLALLPIGPNAKEPMTDKLAKYSVRFGESFVPNFYRQLVHATRTNRDETRVWGRSTGEKILMAGRRVAEHLLPIKYEAKIDMWGRPLPSGVAPFWSAPLTDFSYRLLSPTYQSPDQPTKGDQLIARWNAENPDDHRSLNPPTPYFKINGKKYAMTPEEYEEYQMVAGTLANKIVSRIPDTEHPTEATMKRIETAIKNSRKTAREKLIGKWRKAHKPRPPSPSPSPVAVAAP